MDDRIKKASEYYTNGHYCSQAVLGAFCEEYGFDKETAFKISCGLNSGARCAEICGAVTGAILVIGLKYGSSKEICNLKTEEFIRHFKENNESVVCCDLLGCDISTPEGKEYALSKNLFTTQCLELVEKAAQLLVDLDY